MNKEQYRCNMEYAHSLVACIHSLRYKLSTIAPMLSHRYAAF